MVKKLLLLLTLVVCIGFSFNIYAQVNSNRVELLTRLMDVYAPQQLVKNQPVKSTNCDSYSCDVLIKLSLGEHPWQSTYPELEYILGASTIVLKEVSEDEYTYENKAKFSYTENIGEEISHGGDVIIKERSLEKIELGYGSTYLYLHEVNLENNTALFELIFRN